jgi:hypothetical protein
MKKLIYGVACAALLLTAGCKTTEQDYKRAYDRTINSVDSTRTEFSETIYGRYRRAVRDEQLKVGNDTIDTRIADVFVTKDGGGTNSDMKRYCVIAAEFKQLFNATSMKDRLIEQGKKAFLVENPEPYYYVVAGSYAEVDSALLLIDDLNKQSIIKFKSPCPYILQPSRRR